MIIKRNFSPIKVVPYVAAELGFVASVATVVCAARVSLPFGPLGVLGTALAIFLGFRNNSAYARWWEARTVWASVASSTRTLARLVGSAVDHAGKLGKGGTEHGRETYKRELLYRQIAFAHALRLHLRAEDGWDQLVPFLPQGDLARIRAAANRPNVILQVQAERLKDGVREEKLGPFDPISIDPTLTALAAAQASCERIKATPLLRQYEFFTRMFLWTFLALLPPSVSGLVTARWTAVPIAIVIGFIYAITNKVGQVTEDPFENRIQDVPLTAICITIERDLREQLGEHELPPPALPVNGYLS